MESLYTPYLSDESKYVELSDEALNHARVLRLREGEVVLLTNGIGLCARSVIEKTDKTTVLCRVQEMLPQYGELPYTLILALGVLDNRERMEFAVEKAVELGVQKIIPLLTDNGEKYATNRIKTDRLQAKALAATQQSHRSTIPTIHAPTSIDELLKMLSEYSQKENEDVRVILADVDGVVPTQIPIQQNLKPCICVCIGAEGGFSKREIDILRTFPQANVWNLASRRLRAETAALVCLSAVTQLLRV